MYTIYLNHVNLGVLILLINDMLNIADYFLKISTNVSYYDV